jgi:hypothetical protein
MRTKVVYTYLFDTYATGCIHLLLTHNLAIGKGNTLPPTLRQNCVKVILLERKQYVNLKRRYPLSRLYIVLYPQY